MTDCRLASTAATNAVRSFWLLGLLNNAPWVLMLAVATNISAGGVALVFLSNQIPGLIVKVSAPYWFHLVSYKCRVLMASVTMGLACFLVGCGGLLRDEKIMADDDDDNNHGINNTTDQESKDDAGNSRNNWGLALELLGVSFISFSCNLGEASLLALAGKFDSMILPALSSSDSYQVISEEQTQVNTNTYNNTSQQNNESDAIFAEEYDLDGNDNDETESEDDAGKLRKEENNTANQQACITAFSSGTGIAGMVGYGYKALFSDFFGLGLTATVWSAMIWAVAYLHIYRRGLYSVEQNSMQQDTEEVVGPSLASESSLLVNNEHGSSDTDPAQQGHTHNTARAVSSSALEMVHTTEAIHPNPMQQLEIMPPTQTNSTIGSCDLTASQRFVLVCSLWPYTIPLFTVYAAEYMLQAGVWPAIGFPVTSATARAQFYQYGNFSYQAGVFISRSSGNICTASIPILWLMPCLQVINLYFFWLNSIHHFWYNYSLLLPCFLAGLLGGGVYVQGYSRVNLDMPAELKEFAIASVGIADSLGILVADILSLFIQSCIYRLNNIEGAVVDCPVNTNITAGLGFALVQL